MTFDEFFIRATAGAKPYAYQRRFATSIELPALLPVATGLGKSATLILGWLYRRREHPEEAIRQSTPRRLAYCLPMRTLVEQTEERAKHWLGNLKLSGEVAVHVLMGGAEANAMLSRPMRSPWTLG